MPEPKKNSEPQDAIDQRDTERLPETIKGYVDADPTKGARLSPPGDPVELKLIRCHRGVAIYRGEVLEKQTVKKPDFEGGETDEEIEVPRTVAIKLELAKVPGLKPGGPAAPPPPPAPLKPERPADE